VTARILILAAHPDDPEFHAGGLITRHVQAGNIVKMISVTNGGAGHHVYQPAELIPLRKKEATAAGAVLGAEYIVWDYPDACLTSNLDLRETIIGEMRAFNPDLVLTHRPYDYHPDHRAVGQAVQDASYLVTVPLVVPEAPILKNAPVVAYMIDLFTRPCRLRADVIIDIQNELPMILNAWSEHRSQVYEFLPFNEGVLDQVPRNPEDQRNWLESFFLMHSGDRVGHFKTEIKHAFGRDANPTSIEAYEISEYAGRFDNAARRHLFFGEPSGVVEK